ncbi:hypothetical protein IKF15_03045 [Candidatus Saccharibacteria bacterium]|nr:hypothetical protein [Candidatus Saccharibacteria bacterium]
MGKMILGGFLMGVVIGLGLLCGDNGYAATFRLGDIVDKEAKIKITKKVAGVTNPLNESFLYGVAESAGNPEPIVGLMNSFSVDFVRVVPDVRHVATVTKELDLSELKFSRAGQYRFVIRERSSNAPIMMPKDRETYEVLITVKNKIDESGKMTGGLVAEIASLATKGSNGAKAEIVFETTQKMTYIEVAKEVEGSMADAGEYFKFLVEIQEENVGDRYEIHGQDETVVYLGEVVRTQTEYIAGQKNYIYLKHGQVATIGKRADGLRQVPILFTYDVREEGADTYSIVVDKGTWRECACKIVSKVTFPEPLSSEEAAEEETFLLGNVTKFVNTKAETVETGVANGAIELIGAAGLASGGLLVVSGKRMKYG